MKPLAFLVTVTDGHITFEPVKPIPATLSELGEIGWANKELTQMTAEFKNMIRAIQNAERALNRWYTHPGWKGTL